MKGTLKMEQNKIKSLVNIINRLEIKDKIRLAIMLSDSDNTSLIYDKKAMYAKYDTLLREIDEEYRTTLMNFNKYKTLTLIVASIIEMEKEEHNQVALYLFNNIEL